MSLIDCAFEWIVVAVTPSCPAGLRYDNEKLDLKFNLTISIFIVKTLELLGVLANITMSYTCVGDLDRLLVELDDVQQVFGKGMRPNVIFFDLLDLESI
ncbi:hypothetical protein Tco_0773625 [Tanacetum coccineum]|uniref:Uncharacterized protein n=1 Tax=Tanacetum coccineum TaxID=301880 RepID=A0ABQ4ZLE2_9ASTR